MTLKVLIVDDSNFFQHRLKDMLNECADLSVVGLASNGRDAVEKARELKPDVITMDYEMPVMDGITAIRHILEERSVPILMFSSLTYEGARITLDALDAGAVDFLPKNFSEISSNSAQLKKKLHDRIVAITRGHNSSAGRSSPVLGRARLADTPASLSVPKVLPSTSSAATNPASRSLKGKIQLLMIGASTGGPVALAEVLSNIPARFSVPIVLIQHMPENFTSAFAERLNTLCHIEVRVAEDGESLRPGVALLAPGGKQLMIDKRRHVKVIESDPRINYRPSVDITFGSGGNVYADRAMGLVLTGMGSDGCEGARIIKQQGGVIWSQDEDSSVIYGMPMAVVKARLSDRVLSLHDISDSLIKEL